MEGGRRTGGLKGMSDAESTQWCAKFFTVHAQRNGQALLNPFARLLNQ
jgi:hypothetical protein